MLSTHSALEPEIKSTIINQLLEKGQLNKNELIINEFTVGDFSRRVDLALVNSNNLFAFEVKSEADSLTRLEVQVDKYLEYFDKVTVVVAPKHTQKVLHQTPLHVAVWEFSDGVISVKRKGKLQKTISKQKFIDMMTACELLKLTKKFGLNMDTTRRCFLEEALMVVPRYKLREEAIGAIQARYKVRNDKFLDEVMERKATPNDLKLLKITKDIVTHETTAIKSKIESFIEVLNGIQIGAIQVNNTNQQWY